MASRAWENRQGRGSGSGLTQGALGKREGRGLGPRGLGELSPQSGCLPLPVCPDGLMVTTRPGYRAREPAGLKVVVVS